MQCQDHATTGGVRRATVGTPVGGSCVVSVMENPVGRLQPAEAVENVRYS